MNEPLSTAPNRVTIPFPIAILLIAQIALLCLLIVRGVERFQERKILRQQIEQSQQLRLELSKHH